MWYPDFMGNRTRSNPLPSQDPQFSREHLELVIDHAPIALFSIDNQGIITGAEGAGLIPLGMTPEELKGQSVWELYEQSPQILENIRRTFAGESFVEQVQIKHGPGAGQHYLTRYTPRHNQHGEVESIVGVALNISSFQEVQKELTQSNQQYQLLFDNIPTPMWICELNSFSILAVNQSALDTYGYTQEEFLSMNFLDLHPQEDWALIEEQLLQATDQFGKSLPWKHRREDGSFLDIEITAGSTKHNLQRARIIMGIDTTEQLRAQRKAWYHSYHDILTGLPNRTLFVDRLQIALARATRHEEQLAVLFLDLDRFKNINDTLGHAVGDDLLRIISSRVSDALREDDTVARLGGDDFMILISELEQVEDAVSVGEKLLEVISEPCTLEGRELRVTGTVGIAIFPNDGIEPETLMKKADTAMNRGKEQGRGNVQLYTLGMNVRAFEHLVMENSLHRAIEKDQLILHYQPQIEVQSGRIIGVEALVRWAHPELGIIPPLKFIPVAEETGQIVLIGEWILREACKRYRTWQKIGIQPRRIGVNLSARQFHASNLVSRIVHCLEENRLDPKCLGLEITETTAMQDADYTRDVLRELADMGIHLSIDDFGTGYSSLSYLKKFPIHSLKIDQSFVRDLHNDPNDAAIATAIIALAKSLDLKVFAEGVSTVEQFEYLKMAGCNFMQGNLFSEPLSTETVEALLSSGKKSWIS